MHRPARPAPARASSVSRADSLLRGGYGRQVDREPGALAGSRLTRELAPVSAHDAVHQRQAETEPAEATRRRRVALAEVVEDRLQPVGGDPDALVGDADLHHGGIGIRRAGTERDLAAPGGVLDGVVDQLVERLQEVAPI